MNGCSISKQGQNMKDEFLKQILIGIGVVVLFTFVLTTFIYLLAS